MISDAAGTEVLPGRVVRREGEPATQDPAADEAYDGLGATWELFSAAYGRNSLDGRGLPLLATVHYGRDYDNAFWDGTQMVFGDGDGRCFRRFTVSLDVIGHELTHGVTELTAGLDLPWPVGCAQREHLGRVRLVGAAARARPEREEADWLIGADLFTDAVQGVALRSMKAPGTAYDDPVLGKDPQPAHMDDYVQTSDDNGGVHINSGIPNHAFYLAASAIGGNAWAGAGRIWYAALTGPGISADCDFATFAGLTLAAALAEFGDASPEVTAVESAWREVGVLRPAAPLPRAGAVGRRPAPVRAARQRARVGRPSSSCGARAGSRACGASAPCDWTSCRSTMHTTGAACWSTSASQRSSTDPPPRRVLLRGPVLSPGRAGQPARARAARRGPGPLRAHAPGSGLISR